MKNEEFKERWKTFKSIILIMIITFILTALFFLVLFKVLVYYVWLIDNIYIFMVITVCITLLLLIGYVANWLLIEPLKNRS